MNKGKKRWIAFGAASVLGLVAFLPPWMAIVTALLPCKNSVFTERVSPDGKFRFEEFM